MRGIYIGFKQMEKGTIDRGGDTCRTNTLSELPNAL